MLAYLMQVLLAVLARRCDWEVNLEEPIRPFPIPTPANGLPMRMWAMARSHRLRSPLPDEELGGSRLVGGCCFRNRASNAPTACWTRRDWGNRTLSGRDCLVQLFMITFTTV